MADAAVVFEVVSGNYRVQHAAVVIPVEQIDELRLLSTHPTGGPAKRTQGGKEKWIIPMTCGRSSSSC